MIFNACLLILLPSKGFRNLKSVLYTTYYPTGVEITYSSHVSTDTICHKHLYNKYLEMRMRRSLVLFAVVALVALFAVTSMPASQLASADHKAHTSKGKISLHQVAVIPETHGKILNATALKKQLKGPYGESDVIGGMMSGGY